MARPAITEIHPQTVLQGQTIRSKETKTDEVVRSVSVVVHLANGTDEVYNDDETVKLVAQPTPDFPKELTGQS